MTTKQFVLVSCTERELAHSTFKTFDEALKATYDELIDCIVLHDEYFDYKDIPLSEEKYRFATADGEFELDWDKSNNTLTAYSNLRNMNVDYKLFIV